MAKKNYENVEKITELLTDNKLGSLQKRILSTEKNLSDIIKKLTALEVEKAEKIQKISIVNDLPKDEEDGDSNS